MLSFDDVISRIDLEAKTRSIGTLQEWRKQNKGLKRLAARGVFEYANDPGWAFHVGGRNELQFNVGFEDFDPIHNLRFGVAFSLELSQSLPDISVLVPKIARFNEFVRANSASVSKLHMWHWADGNRSSRYDPQPVETSLVREGVFIFLGGITSRSAPDFEEVMDTLDFLLPLYQYVEGNDDVVTLHTGTLPIKPGCSLKLSSTTAQQVARTLDIVLLHNDLQYVLYHELVAEFGYDCVAMEHPAHGGGRIDIIVQTPSCRILYEIKTAASARACIREALGQLMEYALWPGGPAVTKIVVVGTGPITENAELYISTLNAGFSTPLAYRQVTLR